MKARKLMQPKATKPRQPSRLLQKEPSGPQTDEPDFDVERAFVSYPPDYAELDAVLNKSALSCVFASDLRERHPETWLTLRIALEALEDDPLALLRILVICDVLRLYPPGAVLHKLAEAAEVFLSSDKPQSLDKLLGVAIKKGSKAPGKLLNAQLNREALYREMLQIVVGERVTNIAAAERVAAKYGVDVAGLNNGFSKLFPAEYVELARQEREAAGRGEPGVNPT